MKLHLDVDETYDVVDVPSVSEMSPGAVLSPRRGAALQENKKRLGGGSDGELTMRDDDDDDYTTEGKPRTGLQPLDIDDDFGDMRFRVNGIVVDREVKGGPKPNWEGMYQMLYQTSTPNGQKMALVLLVMVSVSVCCAVLDSVKSIRDEVGNYLLVLEFFFTIVFSIEYALRVLCVRKPQEYVLSLIGLIDISALVPSYLGFFIPSARPLLHLAVLRIFRVMRVFRVLRLVRFVDASAALSDNIHTNKRRIIVFLVGLSTMILVIGCAMYLIEGEPNNFGNIPVSLYWTVVTITTVGYGDIAPQTILGRMLATVVMFAGYGIIACPLVLSQSGTQDIFTEVIECPRCFRRRHQADANFCRVCGTSLRQPRVKSIKARLRMNKLKSPGMASGLSSTTSTSKSNARLLSDLDTDTINL